MAKGGFPSLCFSLQWVLLLEGPQRAQGGLLQLAKSLEAEKHQKQANSRGQFLGMSFLIAGDLSGKCLHFKSIFFLMILGLMDPAQDLGRCPGWWRVLERSDWLKGQVGKDNLG